MVPIATRTLRIVEGEDEQEVIVRLFMPEDDGDAWKCAYEIGWPGKPRIYHAVGQDAVQALLLAMQQVGIELYTSAQHNAGTLVLDVPGQGYGFPVPPNMRDLLIGDDQTSFG